MTNKIKRGGETSYNMLLNQHLPAFPSLELKKEALKDQLAQIERLLYRDDIPEAKKENLRRLRTFIKVKPIQDEVRRELTKDYDMLNESFQKSQEKDRSVTMFEERLLDLNYYTRAKILSFPQKRERIERIEQQLRMGQEQRKKTSQREFLNELLTHAREFIDFHKKNKLMSRKRGLMVRQFLDSREKKKQQLEDKEEKKRIQ